MLRRPRVPVFYAELPISICVQGEAPDAAAFIGFPRLKGRSQPVTLRPTRAVLVYAERPTIRYPDLNMIEGAEVS